MERFQEVSNDKSRKRSNSETLPSSQFPEAFNFFELGRVTPITRAQGSNWSTETWSQILRATDWPTLEISLFNGVSEIFVLFEDTTGLVADGIDIELAHILASRWIAKRYPSQIVLPAPIRRSLGVGPQSQAKLWDFTLQGQEYLFVTQSRSIAVRLIVKERHDAGFR